jgi:hypothetical protein
MFRSSTTDLPSTGSHSPNPVADAAPDFNPAAVTVLNLATSVCIVRDLTDDPVFDANPDGLEDGPVFDTYVHDRVNTDLATGVTFGDEPLFDEELEHEEADLITYQCVIIGSNIATPATTIDAPSTCSTKCLHLAINTDLVGKYCCNNAGVKFIIGSLQVYSELEEVGLLYPLCVLLNAYCSSLGDRGGMCLTDFGLLRLLRGIVTPFPLENQPDYVAPDGFESNCWDPRLAEGLEFLALGKSRVNLNWDPGVAGCLWFMELGRSQADFHWILNHLRICCPYSL